MYVYVLLTKLYSNRNQQEMLYCMLRGVYSDYKTCEKEMFTRFNNMLLAKQDEILTTTETTGLQCSIGATKKLGILWKDGKVTEYCIHERILDQ
jgi:hypothetical protein